MTISDSIDKFVNNFNIPMECVRHFSCNVEELKIKLVDNSERLICKNVEEITDQEFMDYFVYFNDLVKDKFKKYYSSEEFIFLYFSILQLDNLNSLTDEVLIVAFNSYYYLDDDHYIFENDYFYEIIHKELNKRKKGDFCAV